MIFFFGKFRFTLSTILFFGLVWKNYVVPVYNFHFSRGIVIRREDEQNWPNTLQYNRDEYHSIWRDT